MASLGTELWERRFVLRLNRGPVDQIERYFLVRLASEQPAVRNTSTEDICELRWWRFQELVSTSERVYPDGFSERLPELLAGQNPGA